MIDQLTLLRDLLESATADAECPPNGVLITAGRPAAPSTEGLDCQTMIYVYGSNVFDENQDDPNACLVKSRWVMAYEIWTCYPEDWEDQIGTDSAEDAAACLYELMSLAWCALVEAKDDGYFCDCSDLELGPLQLLTRLGGAVSAIGQVGIPYLCPVPEEESPTSP